MTTNTDVAMPELLPCPFCGSADIFIVPEEKGSGGQWVGPIYVICAKCKVEQCADYESDAITAWNTRAAIEQAAGAVPEGWKDRLLHALERAAAVESALRALVDECDNDKVAGWEERMGTCIDNANRLLSAPYVPASPTPPKQQLTQAQMEKIWGVYAGPGSHPETITRAIEKEVHLGGGEGGRVHGELARAVLRLNAAWNSEAPEASLAGHIDLCRRLALQDQGVVQVPLTLSQIDLAVRNAHLAFCLDKFTSFEVALTRKVEAAHDIKETS